MSATQQATCSTCKHLQQAYWGDEGDRIHFCGKKNERRRDAFKTSGDFAQDFMAEFRTFFDASHRTLACKYYEEREPLPAPVMALLKEIDANGGEKDFAFFSDENRLCEQINGLWLECVEYSRRNDGRREYRLTAVGKAILKGGA